MQDAAIELQPVNDVDIDNCIDSFKHDSAGRPQKYSAHVLPNLNKIHEWALKGVPDYIIAQSIGVNPRTYVEYKKLYPELQECYKFADAVLTQNVINSLYRKAIGYRETTQKLTKDGETIDIEEYYPADTTAIQVWLYNKDPERWKRYGGGSLQITNNTLNLGTENGEIKQLISNYNKLQDFAQSIQIPESLEPVSPEGDSD